MCVFADKSHTHTVLCDFACVVVPFWLAAPLSRFSGRQGEFQFFQKEKKVSSLELLRGRAYIHCTGSDIRREAQAKSQSRRPLASPEREQPTAERRSNSS